MGETSERSGTPRSIRQQRILDVAAENPDASIDEIAGSIPSVTPDLVERVLEDYGDPAGGEPENIDPATNGASPEADDEAEPVHLTREQAEILRAVDAHPDATQAELADQLGVTAPTVCKRVNAIPGFDWEDRVAFVERVSETLAAPSSNGGPTVISGGPDDHPTAALQERIAKLEEDVGALSESSSSVFSDPELAHKVVRACIEADSITKEEELEILQAFIC